MTLSSEFLPAMQHYALLAVALTLFSLSLAHVKRRFSNWLWLVLMAPPIAQMEWSLWEAISGTVAADGTDSQPLIVLQALAHGIVIVLVLAVALYIASQSSNKLPRRVRLGPTVGLPPK